ncbi:Uma2 family endonuclease [Pedobacter metabolipauper]|uniref:Uma2 family endonuclease n=1 Tax=Pedobacter metabolipauper TaxID=425513 RepID=A0A4R6T1C1_9SPHI|nr:Uma2 family endonuclease [Pedobacter metabolipauper]TDQ11280.1 Uma2 family endonuclease [Pedobacter metabolipauper]
MINTYITQQINTRYRVNTLKLSSVHEDDASGSYTYAHYLKWDLVARAELIRGKRYKMNGTASLHQRVSREINWELYNYLANKPYELFAAPFDVRLCGKSDSDQEILTVVQPDLCIIGDPCKVDEKGCLGAPDIIIEILSAGHMKHDLQVKYKLYQEFKVPEYWIINPFKSSLLKYSLKKNGLYDAGQLYTMVDVFKSDLLPGFSLNLQQIFSRVKH